jgi:hypothetical protein
MFACCERDLLSRVEICSFGKLEVCASSNDSCVNEAEINSSSQVEGSGSRKQGKMKHGEEAHMEAQTLRQNTPQTPQWRQIGTNKTTHRWHVQSTYAASFETC